MPNQQPKQPIWQLSMLDFVEISAVAAPAAWCVSWSTWARNDIWWLIGFELALGILLFLIARFWQRRGVAFSFSLTFAVGLFFVVGLPSSVSQWFVKEASAVHHQIVKTNPHGLQFVMTSVGILILLGMAGAVTGHCLFRWTIRIARLLRIGWQTAPPQRPNRILRAAFAVLEAAPIIALGAWLLYDFTRPRISFVRKIDGFRISARGVETPEMPLWTLSRDGRRLLILDTEQRLHDIEIASEEIAGSGDQLTAPIDWSPRLSNLAEAKFHLMRESFDGKLLVVWSEAADSQFLFCDLIETKTGRIISRKGILGSAIVKGVSPSGNLLVLKENGPTLAENERLLVWDVVTNRICCQLIPGALVGTARDYFVVLNNSGTLFAADFSLNNQEAGWNVPVFSRDKKQVALLEKVECRGNISDPSLIFSNDGNWVWGRFARSYNPLLRSYSINEQVVSLDQSIRRIGDTQPQIWNQRESIVLDPVCSRFMRFNHDSEFEYDERENWFDIASSGDGPTYENFLPVLPIVGVQIQRQVVRRRIWLHDLSTGRQLAMSTSPHPLKGWGFMNSIDPFPYEYDPVRIQFSQNGELAVILRWSNPSNYSFDVWRLPVPKNHISVNH